LQNFSLPEERGHQGFDHKKLFLWLSSIYLTRGVCELANSWGSPDYFKLGMELIIEVVVSE